MLALFNLIVQISSTSSLSFPPSSSTPADFSSLSAPVPVQQQHPCYSPDRAALQEVAASFSSLSAEVDSFFRLHWGSEMDCCSWLGVTCSSAINNTTSIFSNHTANSKVMYNSPVVGLSLSSIVSREGNLPLALCGLSTLVSLDLSSNSLIGSIPSCIGHNLTSLQDLRLSFNRLTSTIPQSFALLTRLQTLDLNQNFFLYGSIAPLTNLSLLTLLDLHVNSFNGTLLPFKFHTPRLNYLDLSSNLFSGSISIINGPPNLQNLDLSNTLISGSMSPASFSTTPLLKHLGISSKEQLAGVNIPSLEHLPHLEQMVLSMSISATSLGNLFCKFKSLNTLTISTYPWQESKYDGTSDLDDKLLCERPSSVSLTELDLSGQGLTGPFPAWFGDFTRLESLLLSGNKFQGSIPQEWQALTQLTALELSGDSPSTPVVLSQQIQSWLFRLPLEDLSLSSMGLTSYDLQCAGLSLFNLTLKKLDLSDNHISPGYSLWQCLAHHNFSHLDHLILSNNPLAIQLQPLLPQIITTLDLSFCQLSGSLTNMEMPLARLMYLGHNNLTGSIPSQIGTVGSSIVWLDLSYNKLTGLIPTSIWNLTGISTLLLHNNYLHGEVPSQGLGIFLGILSLANNYLTKASFLNVTIFNDVYILDLSYNKLEGGVEDMLGEEYSVLPRLRVLLLGNNQLTGSIPTSLGNSTPFLTTIDLSNNKLTGAIPHSLQHLPALQFRLGVLADTTNIYYTLQSVKNVNFKPYFSRGYLDLSSNNLSGSIPEGLGVLLGLNDLNLSRNQLSGPIPPSLAHLIYLESLDLCFNKLQGSIPMAFSQLSSLEVFNVSFNPELNGQIPGGSPQLEIAGSYEGDPNLCGQVLHKDCGEQILVASPEPYIQQHEKLGVKERISSVIKWIEEWATIPGICVGHVLGMGLTIWALKLLHFYQ